MIDIKASVSGREVILSGVRGIKNAVRSRLIADLGAQQIARIKARTFAGKTLTGRAMKPSIRAERDNGQTLVDTGMMIASMTTTVRNPYQGQVHFPDLIQAKKAFWNHNGTGIYAGRGRIKPTNKKALSWKVRGGERFAFRSIAGTPARPFFGIGEGDEVAMLKKAEDFMIKNSAGLLR